MEELVLRSEVWFDFSGSVHIILQVYIFKLLNSKNVERNKNDQRRYKCAFFKFQGVRYRKKIFQCGHHVVFQTFGVTNKK